MREQQGHARNAVDNLAFDSWLRRGAVPNDIVAMASKIEAGPTEFKFNPYHDPSNGRFTFATGGLPRAASYTGMTARGLSVIKPLSGGGVDRNGRLVPEQFPPDPYALANPAAALAHYVSGSGEDRNYYFNNVDTSKVRLSDFPGILELANDAKPGLYPVVFAAGSYNGNFLGVHDTSSWATVGGLNLRASGVLVIAENGHYNFSGNISAGTDSYDFGRRSGRSTAADALTAIGRLVPGTSFRVHLIGSKPYAASGRR